MPAPARRARAMWVALAASAPLAAAGCGSQGGGSIIAAGAAPPPRGTMAIAVPARPRELDPLLAASAVDTLVSRQLFEPPVERLSGPYGEPRHRPGIALAVRPAAGGTVWRIRLRSGVRFQDGSPLDASAVAANAERWATTAAGRALLPGLVAADAPRPDLVRLLFDRAVGGVRRRLASPRLGLVSPRELGSRGGGAALTGGAGAGTGAFQLRRGEAGTDVLARNTRWWGTGRELGPALDQVELRIVPSAAERVRLLRSGDVEAALDLPASEVPRLRRDPLLMALTAPGRGAIGLERSVRGIVSAARPPLLSEVWLTTISGG